VDTVVSAQGLSASTIEKGWSALVTVGCLAAAVVFGLYWSHKADAEMDKVKPVANAAKLNSFLAAKGVAKRLKEKVRCKIDKDIQIAEQALPAILSSNTLSHRVKDELKHHHKWFGIVFYFSRSFPRVLRVLSLATNVIIMLFIQSITYSLTNPDDGTCELLKTETSCLEPDSPYATGQSKCFWDANTSKCALVQPDSDIKVILFVAIFSALISTPFALLVDWIIMHVLSAPTRPQATPTDALVASPAAAVPLSTSVTARRGRSSHIAGQDLTAIVPQTSADVLPASARKRSSARGNARGIFGSVLGLLTGSGAESTSAQERAVALSAHADLRKLVAELSAYRGTLTTDEKTEFDGKDVQTFLPCTSSL
jgi:hypothetical protein